MKKAKIFSLAALMLGVSLTQTSCIGSFSLFNKVLEWNKGMNKWVGELVFLVFWILPVYGIAMFLDVVILNSIEFWTGSNPVAMKEGETETQLVKGEDGNNYSITASKNRFDVKQLDGENAGNTYAFVFNPQNNSWSFENEGQQIELASFNQETQEYVVTYPDGSQLALDANQSLETTKDELDAYNFAFASK